MQFAVVSSALLLASLCILPSEGVDFPEGADQCTVSCKTVPGSFVISSVPPKKNLCTKTKGQRGDDFITTIEVKKDFDYCQMCVELRHVKEIKISYMVAGLKTGETISDVPRELCFEKADLMSMTVTFKPKAGKKVVIEDFVFGCCITRPDCVTVLKDSNVGPLLLAAFHEDGFSGFESNGCSCESATICSCCAGISTPFQFEACGIIESDGNNTITVKLTFNGNVLQQWTISVNDPEPLCVGIPGVPFGELCAVVYNIQIPPPQFVGCLKIEVKMFGAVVFSLDVGCFP